MDKFRVFETEHFLNDLKQDFSGNQERIKIKLLNLVYPQLRQNPYFGKNIKKLRDSRLSTWRYRIGEYRFFYTIDDHKKVVFMIAADNRQNAY